MKRGRVVVNDLMQTNYIYFLTEPIDENFHPGFRPEPTPKEMLELEVFGGKYMKSPSQGTDGLTESNIIFNG